MAGPGEYLDPNGVFGLLKQMPGLLGQYNMALEQQRRQQEMQQLAQIPRQAPVTDNAAGRLFGTRGRAGKNDALMAAGASFAEDGGSFAGSLTRAVGAGREAGQGGDQQAYQAQLDNRMMELAQRGLLEPMFTQALATGDHETAKTIGTFLNAQRGGRAQGLISVSPGSRIYDPAAREEVFANPAAPKRPPGLGSPQKIVGPDGTPIMAAWDSQAGRYVDTGSKPVPDVSAQQMGLFASGLAGANRQMADLAARGYVGPSYIEQLVFDQPPGPVRNALQGLLSDDAQAFNTSSQRFLEFFLRPVTGARIADEEVRRGQFLFIPLPGDSAATQQLKTENRRMFERAMQVRAQRQGYSASADVTFTVLADEVFGPGDQNAAQNRGVPAGEYDEAAEDDYLFGEE